jgi:hypothetical protein
MTSESHFPSLLLGLSFPVISNKSRELQVQVFNVQLPQLSLNDRSPAGLLLLGVQPAPLFLLAHGPCGPDVASPAVSRTLRRSILDLDCVCVSLGLMRPEARPRGLGSYQDA